jgi:hypothetical protein
MCVCERERYREYACVRESKPEGAIEKKSERENEGASWSESEKESELTFQLKGINHKQSARWQHLSQLKASAFFSLQENSVVMKHSNLYLGLVMPSGE